MRKYVKAGSWEKFGVLNFRCQGKRINNDTYPVISIQDTHDVQRKLIDGTLVEVKGFPATKPTESKQTEQKPQSKKDVDNKKKS